MIPRDAPLSLRAAKRSVAAAVAPESARDLDAVNALVAACFDSADYREGRTAFMEKRTPEFRGA